MENEIREFFHQTAPLPSDPIAFRLELNARLAAMEQIKAYHSREIRRANRTRFALFVAGLVLGGTVAGFFILHPVDLPTLSTQYFNNPSCIESVKHLFWPIAGLVALLAIALPLLLSRRHRNSLLRY